MNIQELKDLVSEKILETGTLPPTTLMLSRSLGYQPIFINDKPTVQKLRISGIIVAPFHLVGDLQAVGYVCSAWIVSRPSEDYVVAENEPDRVEAVVITVTHLPERNHESIILEVARAGNTLDLLEREEEPIHPAHFEPVNAFIDGFMQGVNQDAS